MIAKLRAVWQAAMQMPYKWAWLLIMLSSMLLFSWWDDLAIWGAGAGWNWWIVPAYYVFEYGVLVPLIVWLGIKTYRKLGIQVAPRELLKAAVSASLWAIIWRWIKRRFKKEAQ